MSSIFRPLIGHKSRRRKKAPSYTRKGFELVSAEVNACVFTAVPDWSPFGGRDVSGVDICVLPGNEFHRPRAHLPPPGEKCCLYWRLAIGKSQTRRDHWAIVYLSRELMSWVGTFMR